MVEREIIHDASDLYFLKPEDISSMDKMGEKSAENLLNAIDNSRTNPLHKLICGLGIRHAGEKAAKILAARYKTLDMLSVAHLQELTAINDIGEKMAESIKDFFENTENVEFLKRLEAGGVNCVEADDGEEIDARFSGMTFVLTGTLKSYTRTEAAEIIEKFGGKTSSSVSKKTTYVLAGVEAGSKLTKAQALGVPIISEDDFEKMCE